MKITAVVPIKLNNMRLPGKNIRNFDDGKPLCWYILETLLSIKEIDSVYVYCSNPDIVNYVPPGVRYLERNQSLDSNKTSMNEVLYAFAKEVNSDIYILSHATSPFITAKSISKGIAAVREDDYDSAFAAKKLQDYIWKNGIPLNYNLDNIPRTQDLEPMYCETSGFYIYERDLIVSLNRRIGNNPFIVEVNEIESIDIDEIEDFEIANAVYNHIKKREDKNEKY